MLRNDLVTAVRSLRRHWGFTAINVVGLGVGIGVSILLLFFVRSELAVNDLFPNADRIHRIDSWHTDASRIRYITTNPLGETIDRQAPGIAARTWLYGIWVTVGANGEYYRRDTFLTNPGFFDVFDVPLRHGDPTTAHAVALPGGGGARVPLRHDGGERAGSSCRPHSTGSDPPG